MMDTLDLEDQQALWKICIDPNLEIKIKSMYNRTTPIFGPGSCMELLTEEFEENYPLESRRAEYFNK